MDDAFELTEQEKDTGGAASPALPADLDAAAVNQQVVRGLLASLTARRSDLEMQIQSAEEDSRREARALLLQLLTLGDSLDRIIRHADPENELTDSLEVLRNQFFQFLEDRDIFPVDIEAGQPFDPACCEVSSRQPRPDLPPDVILSVERRGYTFQARSLRKARVIISYQP